MASLVFILTFLLLVILLMAVVFQAIRKRPVTPQFKIMGYTLGAYVLLWLFFYMISTKTVVPLNTPICFDDWCATVNQIDQGPVAQQELGKLTLDSTYVVLHVTMSNHAKRIAQKPSDPRIYLIDTAGKYWGHSSNGQQWLETVLKSQPSLGQKLDLHESVQTRLVFALPKGRKPFQILIEEGPFISNMIFPASQPVFQVP